MFVVQFLFVAISIFSLGCTSDSGSKGPGAGNIDGTSDTGGGNGVENKAYEAYIVNPENLPAFKQIIAPKLAHLAKLSPQAELVMPTLRRWLLYKHWYVAPVSLGTISKDVIGVSFSPDKTEQLALQTKKSVWIDSARFNQMTMQDQATLIIHEMVMSLYYLKFKSWNDICAEKIYPDMQCSPAEADFLNELFPGTTPKPFNNEDYENIRGVTGIFSGEFSFSTTKHIDDLLIQNNFDRRFTFGLGMESSGSQSAQFKYSQARISFQELKAAFEISKYVNQIPTQCRGVKFTDEFACSFAAQETVVPFGDEGMRLNVLKLDINAITPQGFIGISGMYPGPGTVPGSSIEYVTFKKKVYFFLFHQMMPTSYTIGTSFKSVGVLLIEDLSLAQPQKTLLGVQVVPGVITGRHPERPDDCVFVKPSANSIHNDVILAYSKDLSDFDKNLVRSRAGSMPPFTSCRPVGTIVYPTPGS